MCARTRDTKSLQMWGSSPDRHRTQSLGHGINLGQLSSAPHEETGRLYLPLYLLNYIYLYLSYDRSPRAENETGMPQFTSPTPKNALAGENQHYISMEQSSRPGPVTSDPSTVRSADLLTWAGYIVITATDRLTSWVGKRQPLCHNSCVRKLTAGGS